MAVKDDDFTPSKTVEEVAANLEQPDKFAKIFCNAANSQKEIDLVLKKNIKEVIKTDKEIYDFLKEIMRQVDKEDWRSFLTKIGALGWAVILLAIGGILQALSRHYLQ